MKKIVEINVYTVKRKGVELKKNGYKLRNLPLHMRSSPEEYLNKYQKRIKTTDDFAKAVASQQITSVLELMNITNDWFESSAKEVGSTCMGYVETNVYEMCFFMWKKQY